MRWPLGIGPFDVGLAATLGTANLAVLALFPTASTLVPGRPLQAILAVAAALVLVLRRRHPVGVATTVALLAALCPSYVTGAAIYAAGAYARRAAWLWLLTPLMVVAPFVGSLGWRNFRVNDHVLPAGVTILLALAGLYVGTRRTLIAAATERAERAEREQELLAEQARADERIRLAGEMHDVVTHRVNLMVLQAGALGVRSSDDTVRAASEDLRASGVQALAELRDLVGVLRTGGDPATTDPGADDPADDPGADDPGADDPDGDPDGPAGVVRESASVGMDVGLARTGDPDVLAPTVHRTLLRVVQETLTNARKHAPGARVDVDLRYDEQGVTAAVVNGPATRSDPELAASGGGTGLDGLRRRVTMVGGTFAAGACPAGGFAVRVTLPADVPTTTPGGRRR